MRFASEPIFDDRDSFGEISAIEGLPDREFNSQAFSTNCAQRSASPNPAVAA
jgi:hypothetical protein